MDSRSKQTAETTTFVHTAHMESSSNSSDPGLPMSSVAFSAETMLPDAPSNAYASNETNDIATSYAWVAHEYGSMATGALLPWTPSKWHYSEEAADEIHALHDYVTLLSAADTASDSTVYTSSAFDLGSSDPQTILEGLFASQCSPGSDAVPATRLLELPIPNDFGLPMFDVASSAEAMLPDEPSNLDIPFVDALEAAMLSYEQTGEMIPLGPSKLYASADALHEIELFDNYIAALAEHDVADGYPIYTLAAFDLCHMDPQQAYIGSLDWIEFHVAMQSGASTLVRLPLAWDVLVNDVARSAFVSRVSRRGAASALMPLRR